jgi:hypothetical protein
VDVGEHDDSHAFQSSSVSLTMAGACASPGRVGIRPGPGRAR